MMLQRPSPALIQKYLAKFNADERYRVADEGLEKLFSCYPRNNSLDEILLKVTALNTLYSTNIFDVLGVAKHILGLGIDDALQAHSVDLVHQIEEVRRKGKLRRCYSFATKYCSWHQPSVYPIYDSFVEHLLWLYRKSDNFVSFHRVELLKYPRFYEVVIRFREFYQLEQFSFKELDKFLWYYGQEVKPTSSPAA